MVDSVMTRRSVFTAVLAAPAALAAAAGKRLKSGAPHGAVVTQAELQAIIDAHNELDLAAADIRRRLEAGTPLEPGPLGASTWGSEPLEFYRAGESWWAGLEVGLEIVPAENLRRHAEYIRERADCRPFGSHGVCSRENDYLEFAIC